MKKALSLILLLTMVCIIPIKATYSYWSFDIQPSAQYISDSIQIGFWDFIPEWEPLENYSRGDMVLYNGIIYIARTNNPPFGPGSWIGWVFWREA